MCDFKNKFQRWMDLWKGDDENSILKQIRDMMWFAAIFDILKQVHNISLSYNNNKELPNWAFWNFIYYSYFEIQTNAIMRLLDKRNDVISLRRLVIDIQNNYQCLTRKNILDVLGLPYDYTSGLTRRPIDNTNQSEFNRCVTAEYMHERIDNLAGISSTDQRNPTDTIKRCVLDWIEKRFEAVELKDIEKYRHKFVAHAATPESRNWMNTNDMKITLRKISEAHKILCETANFIAQSILCDGQMSFLAGNILVVFENLDKPLASQDDITAMRNQFGGYEKQIKQWCNWDWSSEFGKSCT